MIGVIDYGMGNIQSVINAFDFISAPIKIVKNAEDLRKVDKIILPGVGAFGEGMNKLNHQGLIDVLNYEVIQQKKPFLGICLGMQLICKESYEFGHFQGFGWIDASVHRLKASSDLRIPHVGWDNLIIKKKNRLIDQEEKNLDVYFVHSYFVDSLNPEYVVASCEYGIEFAASIEKDNIFGVQFHPEKSQNTGLKILKAFLKV